MVLPKVNELFFYFFFFSSRRRHTRLQGDWSSDVCSSDLGGLLLRRTAAERRAAPGLQARIAGLMPGRSRIAASGDCGRLEQCPRARPRMLRATDPGRQELARRPVA